MSEPRRRSIVMIAGALPYPDVPHAGGRYLLALSRELSEHADIAFIVPDSAPNLLGREACEADAVLVGRFSARNAFSSFCARMVGAIERAVRLLHPGAPALGMAWALLTDPRARRLIREADVIDLQWAEFVALGRLIRLVNPKARIIATFHDVLSQLYSQRAGASRGVARGRWRLATRLAASAERHAHRGVDVIATLNEKDAALLRLRGQRTVVVDPPMDDGGALPRHPAAHPTVLFVGYFARPANLDAAAWFVQRIWPGVLESHPNAVLRLVGADPNRQLPRIVRDARNVETVGFVNDLWREYAEAHVCVVPLRAGSGVKFKAIEPLLAGVPTVSTMVGAEGIGGEERFAAVVDDEAGFGEAVAHVLSDLPSADARAAEVQRAIRYQYGAERFSASVADLYRLPVDLLNGESNAQPSKERL